MNMQAAVLEQYNQPLVLREVSTPEPGPCEAVIRVRACGVCGSDLFLRSGGFNSILPIIPGHESSGEVVSTGPDVRNFSPGDRVLIFIYVHCGKCRYCIAGQENICVSAQRLGVDLNGAFAEYIVVPEANLIPLPQGIGFAEGAVLTDAVATPYHALHDIARIQPEETVVVFGVGGIGSNAVQIAHLQGCRIFAVNRSKSKLELAKRLGADVGLHASENVVERIHQETDGLGADVCIQCVGDASVDDLAIASARKGGRVIFVGATTKSFKATSIDFIWRELKVLGSRGFTKRNIMTVVEAYRQGKLQIDHLLQSVLPLREANRALDLLAGGSVLRSVLVNEN